MKILVTGATGFVGRHLLPVLKEKGHELVVLTRDPGRARVRLPVACRIVGWDVYSGGPPPEVFAGVDAVIHLAGESVAAWRWNRRRQLEISRSRVLSTRHLMETLQELDSRPKVFVSASAVGYYGDRGNEELTEQAGSGQGFLAGVCQDWEKEIFEGEALGIRTAALRFGMVLGPDGGPMEKILPPFRLGLGGTLGGGRQWMSWIHVRDLAFLIVHTLEHSDFRGPINAVSPHPVTNREFTRTLGRVLRRPTVLPIPKPVLRQALGEMSQLFLFSQKVSAAKVLESGFKFLYPDLQTALRDICDGTGHVLRIEQWVPTPIEQVFSFFSDVRNLEVMTPAFMGFKVIGTSTESLVEGTRIEYRLKFRGIPIRWQSRITEWRPGVRFCDQQTHGPYALWHHTHEFLEQDGGTLLRDRVHYKIPLGALGDAFAHYFVRQDLEKIFAYRIEKVEELFGKPAG